ncbi:TlpA family protein disulfide reductase [Sphingobacterium kitahiroshimense]|uniref:TlpA disulfide reductase family protein n=1 Tax=Sphingobacterium kitahiroshimense TaxID=470446 RepID=A0ABV0BP14_9SPHI
MLIAVIFSFVSCQSGTKDSQRNNDGPAASDQTPAVSSPRDEVKFLDEYGQNITLSSLKGKVVFINFWATWCGPCIREMPSLQTLVQSFKGNNDIQFLMVDVDGTMDKSQAFMTKNKYDMPVYVPNSALPRGYFDNVVPTTVILDKNGEVVDRLVGGRDYADPKIKMALEQLLQN